MMPFQSGQQPNQAPVAPAPAAAPAAPAPEQSGLQKVQNLEFNQQMQNILLSRIEAIGSQNPNAFDALEAALTRDAALQLLQILPELKPIFDAMGIGDGTPGQQPIAAAPGAGMMPQAANSPVSAGGDDEETEANYGVDDDEEEDDEEEENPLLQNGAASRGLVG